MTTMTVHSELLSELSEPFRALMTGTMREKQEGVAELPAVEPDVFVALYEFASTGDYSVPPPDPHDKCSYLVATLKERNDAFAELCIQDCEQTAQSIIKDGISSNVECEVPEPEAEERFGSEEEPMSKWAPRNKKKSKQHYWASGPYEETEAEISPTNRLWQQFKEQELLQSYTKRIYSLSDTNIMFHAKLYCLAEEKMIEPLKACCLGHLCNDLLRLDLGETTIRDVLDLASLAYTERSRESFNGDDGLRKMVSHYIASQGHNFRASKYFRDVLDAHGELGSDLVHLLLQ